MANKRYYRHGDVLLEKVDAIPRDAKVSKTDIVAEGEATGHAHRLVNGDVFTTPDGEMFVCAKDGAYLKHEEHSREDLDECNYKVTIQREYDDETEWRQVVD